MNDLERLRHSRLDTELIELERYGWIRDLDFKVDHENLCISFDLKQLQELTRHIKRKNSAAGLTSGPSWTE